MIALQLKPANKNLTTNRIGVTLVLFVIALTVSAYFRSSAFPVDLPLSFHVEKHIVIPKHDGGPQQSALTLRDFLLDPSGYYLGMAPAFFGFYGYFGALSAWEEISDNSTNVLNDNINGVAGASAGAMAAVLLAAGIPPRVAAEFCTSISLTDFADFPGLLTVFRGDKFEKIMQDFMTKQKPNTSLNLESAHIPVAVSGFDILGMQGKILRRGSMARAARASACFPLLFQPVGWVDGDENFLLIDGGITDMSGVAGLAALQSHDAKDERRRVINMVVGDFLGASAPSRSELPEGVDASQLVSITIRNLPRCGPLNMANGRLTVEAARRAMQASLDVPMFLGKEDEHYELHIDASYFIP